MSDERDIARLIGIMRALRDPKTGCPWDIQQDFASIAPYTIEEAYEVAGAIEDGDWPALKDELGDLLLQVVYHARMAEERGLFDFGDVVAAISEKMTRRHPHVFGDADTIGSAEAQTVAWEDHKKKERAAKGSGSLLFFNFSAEIESGTERIVRTLLVTSSPTVPLPRVIARVSTAPPPAPAVAP